MFLYAWGPFVLFSFSFVAGVGSLFLFCFFNKGPDSKYFWICGPCGLCHSHSVLPRYPQGNRIGYISEWVWLCPSKTNYKTVSGPDLACGLQLALIYGISLYILKVLFFLCIANIFY